MLTWMILLSSIAGLLVPAIVTTCFHDAVDWHKLLGGPTWDFTRSWASNVTAAGTILSYSALLACFSPTATLVFLSRQTYLALGAIAVWFSVLAPLTFNIISRIFRAFGLPSSSACAFLISAGITVCGLTLQLLMGGCLALELSSAKTLPPTMTITLGICLVILSILLVWYAILTAVDTLQPQPCPPPLQVQVEGQGGAQLQNRAPATWALL